MLLRLQRLHEDITTIQPTDGTPATALATAWEGAPASRSDQRRLQQQHQQHQHQLQQHQQHQASPVAAAEAAAATPLAPSRRPRRRKGSAASKVPSPFCLCLLASRSKQEVSLSLQAVSRARAALEGVEEGRGHAGRWCRWVSSSLAAADAEGSGGGSAGRAGERVGCCCCCCCGCRCLFFCQFDAVSVANRQQLRRERPSSVQLDKDDLNRASKAVVAQVRD